MLAASFTRTSETTPPFPRTVSEALIAAPGQHDAIIAAFTTGADTALRVGAVVTGTLVTAIAAPATGSERK